jgi:hypothetical protein
MDLAYVFISQIMNAKTFLYESREISGEEYPFNGLKYEILLQGII